MKHYKGAVEFPAIRFTESGRYVFTIREISEPDDYWFTDFNEYRAVVTVTEKNGSLTAAIEYPDGKPEFVNCYCPPRLKKHSCRSK
jgi:pilin isopeptide linkage protein